MQPKGGRHHPLSLKKEKVSYRQASIRCSLLSGCGDASVPSCLTALPWWIAPWKWEPFLLYVAFVKSILSQSQENEMMGQRVLDVGYSRQSAT